MKIAYILYPDVIISNKSNGIRSQAESWANVLTEAGHNVDYINNWGNYTWTDYDVIHIYGGGRWAESVARRISAINPFVVISPIVDPIPDFSYRKAFIKNKLSVLSRGLIASNHLDYAEAFKYTKKILVRSSFEAKFINKVYNVPFNKIEIIRLTYSGSCQSKYITFNKDPFCLHISSISQPRKNVLRLIEAAKKYNFKLVLAGNPGTVEQYAPLKNAIGNNPNIEVLGYISEEQKIDLYRAAKVFALPSIEEGVGIVALDAAFYGCNIVITSIPGPKEYYMGNCIECDPFDVDSIGESIKSFIDEKKNFQPMLSEFVAKEYSFEVLRNNLVSLYSNL